MKQIIEFINEKLIINKNIKVNEKEFTDDELRKDYNLIDSNITKEKKKEFKEKYNVDSNSLNEIQRVILDRLRDNRHNKREYDRNDFRDILRYNLPGEYDELVEYLNKEPKEFVKFLLKIYENIIKHNNININAPRSIADKCRVKRYNYLKKYLNI
jgi:hypothetical protein